MSQIIILSKEEINNFDLPPKFNSIQRKQYFSIDSKIDEIIERIDNSTNKIGLILVYSYFKASGRFFTADKFYDEDIDYIVNLLNIPKDQVDFQRYMNKGYRRHKKLICDICNYSLFNDLGKNLLFSEIDSLISNQIRPRQIFSSITSFLELRRVEIPGYYTIANLITDRFNTYEKKILLNLENLLDDKNKKLLDDLIKIPKPIKEGEESREDQERKKLFDRRR